MKRTELVQILVKEGMSEKTLVNFTDKQLKMLSERLVVKKDKLLKDPQLQAMAKTVDMEVVEKKEKWIQKAIDPKKKGQLHKDLDVPKDEKIPSNKLKAAAKKEGKVGQRARMALNLKNLNEWIDGLVDKNYHPIATKADILETISKKIKETVNPMPAGKPKTAHNGMKEFMEYSKPETKPEEKPDTETIPAPDPDKKPSKPKIHPGKNPNPGVQPGPKAKDTGAEKKAKKKKDVKEITPEIAKKKVIGAIGKVLSK